MEGRKIGNCRVNQIERKESSGCDGEKTAGEKNGERERESKGFVRGSRECLFQWSQTVQMAS